MDKEIKLERRTPTWDYLLNDLAFDNLLSKCIHSDSATYQDKFDCHYQTRLMQDELSKYKGKIYDIKTCINQKQYENCEDAINMIMEIIEGKQK